MTKQQFEELKYRMHCAAPAVADSIHPTMVKLGHEWFFFDKNKTIPTKMDVVVMFDTLIDSLRYDEKFPFYQASSGGLNVEIMEWPNSGPGVRMYYSCNEMRHFSPMKK